MSVSVLDESAFFWQRAHFEPFQQWLAKMAYCPDLWVMNVGVDQSGNEDAFAQVNKRSIRIFCACRVNICASDNLSVVNDERNIGVGAEVPSGKGVGVSNTRAR